MIKQRILTVVGAAITMLFVYGGWLLTNELMDRQQDKLMDTVHSIEVKESLSTGLEDEQERVPLSDKEIVDILNIWNRKQVGYYHDPVDGQLTMEEAIKAAISGLSYFCEKGVLPSLISESEYAQTKAFLYDIKGNPSTRESISPAPRPLYSFWSVSLANKKVMIDLIINAQTGQIWTATITSFSEEVNINELSTLKVLQTYETYLHLFNGNQLRSDEYYSVKYYYNNLFGLSVYKKSSDNSPYGMIQFAIGSAE